MAIPLHKGESCPCFELVFEHLSTKFSDSCRPVSDLASKELLLLLEHGHSFQACSCPLSGPGHFIQFYAIPGKWKFFVSIIAYLLWLLVVPLLFFSFSLIYIDIYVYKYYLIF